MICYAWSCMARAYFRHVRGCYGRGLLNGHVDRCLDGITRQHRLTSQFKQPMIVQSWKACDAICIYNADACYWTRTS